MKLDQKINAAEIVSNEDLGLRLMRAAKVDVENTIRCKVTNEHVRTQVALRSGPVLASLTNERFLSATGKLAAGLMGAFGAATEKVDLTIGTATAAPVLQGNADLTAGRPGAYRLTAQKFTP